MSAFIDTIQTQWTALRPILSIHNEDEYDLAVDHLNELLDEIGTNENHPLYDFLDTLGTLIRAYEDEHHPLPDVSGIEMVRYFMDEYDLSQSDMPEIGSQGVVSEVLNGKRELNTRQIKLLAKRFKVSPSVFL